MVSRRTRGCGRFADVFLEAGTSRRVAGEYRHTGTLHARIQPARTSADRRIRKIAQIDTFPLLRIEGKRTTRGSVVQLPLHADEQIFGFGLQLMSFAQRGKKKVARVNADPKIDTGDSNAPVPFYVTTEGIGILVDTARYATFYLGDARPKPACAAEQVGGGANPDPNYTHTVKQSDTCHIVIDVPDAPGVDIYLFAGPDMLSAVKRYNVFSGGGFAPPQWGLGFWYRNMARTNEQDVLTLARKVVLPEGDWHDFWTGGRVAGSVELTVPASMESIPVYVKSGSIVPWADVGQFAGTPETRRITAGVYGDGSLPFALKGSKNNLRLSWNNGQGTAEADGYHVYRWEYLG
jgi:alpha-glucosidase (family GH31 glycosyl hydrolase)